MLPINNNQPIVCHFPDCGFFGNRRQVNDHKKSNHNQPVGVPRGRHAPKMDLEKKRKSGAGTNEEIIVIKGTVQEHVTQLLEILLANRQLDEAGKKTILQATQTDHSMVSIYVEIMLAAQRAQVKRDACEKVWDETCYIISSFKFMANQFKPADDVFDSQPRSRPGTPETYLMQPPLPVSPTLIQAPAPAPAASSSWF